jgi:hypothetical protein
MLLGGIDDAYYFLKVLRSTAENQSSVVDAKFVNAAQ